MVQADLFQVEWWGGAYLPTYNSGVKFILLLVECFSRKIWLHPLKTKSSAATLAGIKKIFEQIAADTPNLPTFSVFLSDKGSELKNASVRAYLESKGVKIIHPETEVKAGMAEVRVSACLCKTVTILPLCCFLGCQQVHTTVDIQISD